MRPPIIDTHVHFNDMTHPTLRWTWLEPGAGHPSIEDPEGYKHVRYVAENLLAEARFCNVTKFVHVQAALGSADPVDESIWLEQMADRTGVPHGIVAEAHLERPDVAEVLTRHAVHPRIRGIRDLAGQEKLTDPRFLAGVRRLADHDLLLEIAPQPHQMSDLVALAGSVSDVTIVLEHAGLPEGPSPEQQRAWRRGIDEVARLPNTVMKISGLGMRDPHWTVDSLRPWGEGCLEAFGPDRCMFGSNWPVDRLFSSYTDLIDAYLDLVGELAPGERSAVLVDTAERIYRL